MGEPELKDTILEKKPFFFWKPVAENLPEEKDT